MILSDKDIVDYLKRGIVKITPRPTEGQIGPASVDLTLSNEFWKPRKVKGKLDLSKVGFSEVMGYFKADEVELKPGQMVLGKTVEKIELPSNISGRLEGRSSFARLGLAIHVTSGFIQPGSRNHQILEIVNLSSNTVLVRAGMRLSQVIFEELKSETSKPYSKFGRIARDQ
ncbi:MAG: dCTP deaminase [Candidatus Micrarchaeota archaeon]|nr:dCTP deaminase [Candidatus Micrarchaeota archaeon]